MFPLFSLSRFFFIWHPPRGLGHMEPLKTQERGPPTHMWESEPIMAECPPSKEHFQHPTDLVKCLLKRSGWVTYEDNTPPIFHIPKHHDVVLKQSSCANDSTQEFLNLNVDKSVATLKPFLYVSSLMNNVPTSNRNL